VGDGVSQFGGFCVEGGKGEGERAAAKRVGGVGVVREDIVVDGGG